MREQLWFRLRSSPMVRRIYQVPTIRAIMSRLSYLLVPSHTKKKLEVQTGPAAGLVFHINPRWERHLWEGNHELRVQEFVAGQSFPDSVFYDIGAGFGFYSALAARMGAKVFAFEPDEANADSLQRHSEMNPGGPNIYVVRLAVAANSGFAGFQPAVQVMGHGNGVLAVSSGSRMVPCTTLDDFIQTNPAPTLIKVDVEGFESDVFRGAVALFARFRPDVICELHDRENRNFVSEWLKDHQYDVTFIDNSTVYPCHVIARPK